MRERGRPEDQTLAQIDDALAAASGVFRSVAVLIARHRLTLTEYDVQELEKIVTASTLARKALISARQAYVRE